MRDVRVQFGREAEKYLSSASHANEAALARCVEVADPQGGPVLDVATGAGHTAFAFAPRCSRVVALDITPEMLEIVARTAAERGLGNIGTQLGWAEDLPFEAASFEGVTCRIAAHHFKSIPRFLAEARRVLTPGGWLLIVDTIGIEDPLADEELQQMETERDPSHVRNLTASQWMHLVEEAGFTIELQETSSYPHNAFSWLDRMSVAEPTRTKIVHKIVYSEGWLRDYLRPTGEAETLTFRLHQMTLLARR